MKVEIKKGHFVQYSEEFLNADNILVKFFSLADFKGVKRVARKYIMETSTRAYYPNGSKRWFYKLAWTYEIYIPKNLLVLNKEDCSLACLAYNVKGTDIMLINSTHYSNGISYQGAEINHCMLIGHNTVRKLFAKALMNDETKLNSVKKTDFNGKYTQVMFIAKYAPESTNYNKSTHSYSRFKTSDNPLINSVLGSDFDEKILNMFGNYEDIMREEMTEILNDKDVIERYVDIKMSLFVENRGPEILEDLTKWLKEEKSEFYGLPEQLLEAMNKIKRLNQ